jgi:DNA (cytosine-5)-methyltransferase 1
LTLRPNSRRSLFLRFRPGPRNCTRSHPVYLFYTENRGHPDPQFRWRSKYWSFLLKLSPDKPAPTIQAQPGPYIGPFYWENRRLRVAELKRLFTFPDEFEFVGSRNSVQAQVGNSVPPLLAEKVVRALHGEDVES